MHIAPISRSISLFNISPKAYLHLSREAYLFSTSHRRHISIYLAKHISILISRRRHISTYLAKHISIKHLAKLIFFNISRSISYFNISRSLFHLDGFTSVIGLPSSVFFQNSRTLTGFSRSFWIFSTVLMSGIPSCT